MKVRALGHDIHRFREKDILAFIKEHPQEVNLGKVDQIWFLDLVVLRGRGLHRSPVVTGAADNDDDDDD